MGDDCPQLVAFSYKGTDAQIGDLAQPTGYRGCDLTLLGVIAQAFNRFLACGLLSTEAADLALEVFQPHDPILLAGMLVFFQTGDFEAGGISRGASFFNFGSGSQQIEFCCITTSVEFGQPCGLFLGKTKRGLGTIQLDLGFTQGGLGCPLVFLTGVFFGLDFFFQDGQLR